MLCEANKEKGPMVIVPCPVVEIMGLGSRLYPAALSSCKAENGAGANA
jgi:hypothetical protein